ncbi:hypothetical protein BKA93DRAFT_618445 [Sparassis latifolia]
MGGVNAVDEDFSLVEDRKGGFGIGKDSSLDLANPVLGRSSPSLGPSQSASQHCLRVPPAVSPFIPDTVSKFFAPAHDRKGLDEVHRASHENTAARVEEFLSDGEELPVLTAPPIESLKTLDHPMNDMQAMSPTSNVDRPSLPHHILSSPVSVDTLDRALQALDADRFPVCADWPEAMTPQRYGAPSFRNDMTRVNCDSEDPGDHAHSDREYEGLQSIFAQMTAQAGSLRDIQDTQLYCSPSYDYDHSTEMHVIHDSRYHQAYASWLSDAADYDDDLVSEIGEDVSAYTQHGSYSLASTCVPIPVDCELAPDRANYSVSAPFSQMGDFDPGFDSRLPHSFQDAAEENVALETQSSWSSCYSAVEPSDEVDGSLRSTESATVALRHFSQGRALLLGMADEGNGRAVLAEQRTVGFDTAEQAVARSLRGHWLPQRL